MTLPPSESLLMGPAHTPPLRDVAPPPGSVSHASQRLRALAALSGSLTDALDPEEAASLVELKALSALGATSAVVVTLGPFPPVIETPIDEQADPILTVVHAIGFRWSSRR